jgi:soluble lytic murein transglycosylase-like protein
MPATAREECGLSRNELKNPQDNLACAAHYLAKNIKRFNDIRLGLCAYNAGPGAIKNGRCPSYKETRNYVRKITSSVGI